MCPPMRIENVLKINVSTNENQECSQNKCIHQWESRIATWLVADWLRGHAAGAQGLEIGPDTGPLGQSSISRIKACQFNPESIAPPQY